MDTTRAKPTNSCCQTTRNLAPLSVATISSMPYAIAISHQRFNWCTREDIVDVDSLHNWLIADHSFLLHIGQCCISVSACQSWPPHALAWQWYLSPLRFWTNQLRWLLVFALSIRHLYRRSINLDVHSWMLCCNGKAHCWKASHRSS